MPSTTGIRRRLSPALLAGAPYRIGDRMADRYLVKDAIGLGPVGYVFRATDEQQGIDVAVKMIHPRFVQTAEEREAFTRAVEPARRFLQPSLARVHDLGVDQGWPYLTYSFLDGLTLRRMIDSRLAKGQTFTLEEVEPFLGQLAAALEASHPIGAHADLKPENVIILPDMLRVVDWGVARGLPRLPFVQAQRQKSTHRYLAPEVVAGAEPDPRADLYALGVLVGEMLTGLTPDEDIPELRLTAPELPEAVEGFYRRALNERPESRFRSVRELYEEFLSLFAPAAAQPVAPAAVEAAAPVAQASVAPGPVSEPAAVTGPEAPLDWAMEPAVVEPVAAQPVAAEPAPAGPAVPAPPEPEPIPAAALPRLDGHAPEAPRHTREVVALEPPAWNGAPAAPPEPRTGSGRWRSLRLWDADETSPEEPASAPREVPLPEPRAAAEATGPQLPLSTDPDLAVLRGAPPPRNGAVGLEHSDEEAERAVAGLTEMEDGPGPAEEDAGDEPLLAEALGVDLVVEGDEPVPVRTETPAVSEPNRTVPPLEPPVREVARPTPVTAASPIPSVAPAVPRLSVDSRPWAAEPRPPPFRREAVAETPHTREASVLVRDAARCARRRSTGGAPCAADHSSPPGGRSPALAGRGPRGDLHAAVGGHRADAHPAGEGRRPSASPRGAGGDARGRHPGSGAQRRLLEPGGAARPGDRRDPGRGAGRGPPTEPRSGSPSRSMRRSPSPPRRSQRAWRPRRVAPPRRRWPRSRTPRISRRSGTRRDVPACAWR